MVMMYHGDGCHCDDMSKQGHVTAMTREESAFMALPHDRTWHANQWEDQSHCFLARCCQVEVHVHVNNS